ncbi:MAG: DNA translocase FtsK 4TM domain-containing protein [Parachlamydiaceae bacterium]
MAKKKTKKKTVPQAQPKPTPPEIKGLILLLCAFFLLLSLISFAFGRESTNLLGLVGHSIGLLIHAIFGLSSYFICIFLTWCGWQLLTAKSIAMLRARAFYFSIFVISTSMLLCIIECYDQEFASELNELFYPSLKSYRLHYHLGGAPFFYLYQDLPILNMQKILNWIGASCFFSIAWLFSLTKLTGVSLFEILSQIKVFYQGFKNSLPSEQEENLIPIKATPNTVKKESLKSEPFNAQSESDFMRYVNLRSSTATQQEVLAIKPETDLRQRPSISKKEVIDFLPEEKEPSIKKTILELPQAPVASQRKKEKRDGLDLTNDFKLPSTSLLTNAKKVDQSSLKKDLRRQAEVLEETLQSFSIEAKVGQINCGPTITSFEVHPAIGVKVQKIKTLENDIALNMEAKSIRIIAPIPGKAAVGIEVPNPYPQEVSFKEMLAHYQQDPKLRIPILLGKAVNGDYVMSDLTKWPHCIIAGATGSGKSVCINTIVMSIVMNLKPDEVRLVMVDPKKVELTPYTSLPHMLAPVITEPKDACTAMNWLVKEMEKRYEILKLTGTRNIESFNHRKINQELESALDIEIPEKIPYIVGIIDELADLMMVASSDIETPIARIAQMARAVGIHLILATQRPSREVITGLIKANFPTRISFKVASRINSQIVLDEVGAESLLGNGDMLFLPPGASHLTRAQGAFIRDEDISNVVKSLCEQAPPNYLIQSFSQLHLAELETAELDENRDSLYEDAKDIILSTGNASTTFLQRKLKIGYARAASLIDQLESRGIVGPAEGSKPRKILVNKRPSPTEEN